MARRTASSSTALNAAMRLVVLYGKERFLIEERTRELTRILDEGFGGVETFLFDGETVEPATVLDELRSYGLMQKHKLVILDNAEVFLAGGRNAADEEDDQAETESPGAAASAAGGGANVTRRPVMERYAENPVPDATLLMRAATWRAGKLDKLIAKASGVILEVSAMNDSAAAQWCVDECPARHGAKIDRPAADLLVARLGPELQHLDTELSKLAAMAGSTQAIIKELVSQSVGLSREEKAWEIQSALATGNAATMLRKLRELLDISRQDEVPIAWAICDFLRKLHTAAQLLGRGVQPRAVMGQAKLWGNTAEPILQLAGRLPPQSIGRLLQAAIQTDMHNKSGVGDPQRNLETLVVRIADTINSKVAR